MPLPKATKGQRWLVRGLGLRIIMSILHDAHGRLYGVRAPTDDYPLTPRYSANANRGRYVRALDLIRRDKRKRPPKRCSHTTPQPALKVGAQGEAEQGQGPDNG